MIHPKRIRLVVERPDGHHSDVAVDGSHVTCDMLNVAETMLLALRNQLDPEEVYAICLRPAYLYDAVARAFGTTREDAKLRLLGAVYGKTGKPVTP